MIASNSITNSEHDNNSVKTPHKINQFQSKVSDFHTRDASNQLVLVLSAAIQSNNYQVQINECNKLTMVIKIGQ